MKKRALFILLPVCFLLASQCGKNPVDPAELIYTISRTKVEVRGRSLFVNDSSFFVKGVGYAPTPVGCANGAHDYFLDASIYTRDLLLLRDMGCNTIRTWAKVTSAAFLDCCYNDGNSPVYVIMGFPFDPNAAISNSSYAANKIAEFKYYVNTFKGHQAVLFWCIGNDDNNTVPNTDAERGKLYGFINNMAKAAHEAEGGEFHPTTTALADLGTLADIGNAARKADDSSMPFLDIWGVNLYPGPYPADFTASFSSFASKSGKPLLVTEYGIDAYANGSGPDEALQATEVLRLYNSLAANTALVCIGGSIMAYADEWWKAGNPSSHDTGGGAAVHQPDGFSNEEWYGLMSAADNGSGPDILTPRPVYTTLKQAWRQ